MRIPLIGCVVVLAVAAGCATQSKPAAKAPASGLNRAPIEWPQKTEHVDGFQQPVYRAGPVLVAGQPTEAALERLTKQEGVTLVVNLRTPEEMANRERIPFDEPAVMQRLGVEYVFIPLGGPNDFPYTPEAVDRFAEALARHDTGTVLLHCAVGWRASHMWAAYLTRCRGLSPDEAYGYAKAMVLSDTPFEGLAGVKATFVPK